MQQFHVCYKKSETTRWTSVTFAAASYRQAIKHIMDFGVINDDSAAVIGQINPISPLDELKIALNKVGVKFFVQEMNGGQISLMMIPPTDSMYNEVIFDATGELCVENYLPEPEQEQEQITIEESEEE